VKILHRLPSMRHDGEPLPADIQGAQLVQIGTAKNNSKSGEFVMEYVPKSQHAKRRLTLLFDGRGMWPSTLGSAKKRLGTSDLTRGFFHGHSSGRFGGDEYGTYIEGGAGNDKFQINAGAAYQEWNGRFPCRIC
jgi:hypothetical protein